MRINCEGKTAYEMLPDANWRLIPGHMHESVARYVCHGGYTGDFLTAVLSNDLKEAIGRADDYNRECIVGWVQFMVGYMPIGSWGSPGALTEWKKVGGFAGLMDSGEKADA